MKNIEKILDNINVNCQSSIRIEDNLVIYFDPYNIKDEVHDADYIFITHSHWDHFDIDSINNILNDNTLLIAPNSVLEKLDRNYNVFEVSPNNSYNLDNITFDTVSSYNIDKNYHPKDLGNVGYILKLNDVTYYISGDTDVVFEIKTIKSDVIFLPVGGVYTMTSDEAFLLANLINPLIAIPTHYGLACGSREDANNFVSHLNKNIISKIYF